MARLEATLVTASMLAADLAAVVDRDRADIRGFMLRDVRFFFLLFRNWLEHDVRAPEGDIDLTQVRRACERRTVARQLVVIRPRTRTPRRPRTRYVLALAGVVALVDELLAWSSDRTFDEGLFVVLFASSYGAPLVRRAEQAGGAAERRHLAKRLDPKAVIATLRKGLGRQRADLESRIAGGDRLFAAAMAARGEGATDAEIMRRLERLSPYQLQHIRPLGELLLSLPVDVRRYEMADGITARRRLIFEPLLLQTRAQLQILDKLELALGA